MSDEREQVGAAKKVLTVADIKALTAGFHRCGWDVGPVKNLNPECGCMCGTVYSESGEPIIGHYGRHSGVRCQHADERGRLRVIGRDGQPPASRLPAPAVSQPVEAAQDRFFDDELHKAALACRCTKTTHKNKARLCDICESAWQQCWDVAEGKINLLPKTVAAQEEAIVSRATFSKREIGGWFPTMHESPQAEPSESAPRRVHPSPANQNWETATVGIDESDLVDPEESQPSTLPQSSQQAQGFEECWKKIEKELKREGIGGVARLKYRSVAVAAWAAVQSQPVAEIPQLVSDGDLAEMAKAKESFNYGVRTVYVSRENRIACELQQYRQRFGKKEQ